MKQLQTPQNQALRICLKVKIRDVRTDELHERTEVPRLENRRKELLCSMMLRKSQKVNPQVRARLTRASAKFNFPTRRRRTQMYKKSPMYRGIHLWDTLDQPVQAAKTKEAFKRAVKNKFQTNMTGKRHTFFLRAHNQRPP